MKVRDLAAICLQRLAWRLEDAAEWLHTAANRLFTFEALPDGEPTLKPDAVTKRAMSILHHRLKDSA